MRTGSLVGINFLEILVCSKDRVHAYYIVEGQILVRSSLRFSFAYGGSLFGIRRVRPP